MKKISESVMYIPLYGFYFLLFFFAAEGKFASGGVPDWFVKQFGSTPLNLFSGALGLQFYLIVTLEALTSLLFLMGLIKLEFLPQKEKVFLRYGLTLACFTFMILDFGLLVVHDHTVAIQVFTYFGFSWLFLTHYKERQS